VNLLSGLAMIEAAVRLGMVRKMDDTISAFPRQPRAGLITISEGGPNRSVVVNSAKAQ